MRAYILSIVGAVLISAVITMIAPSGKMGKFVKGGMKLFTLVVLIAPFVSWFQSGKLSLSAGVLDEDDGYFSACAEMLSARDEEEIAAAVREEFGLEATAEVVRRADATFEREKITVKISDFGISGQGEHKDILDRVQAFLVEQYGDIAEVS